MKYIVEVMLAYEVDAPDMREAQKLGYLRAIDLCDSESDTWEHLDKQMKCLKSQVFSVTDEAVYNRQGAIK
jgi:hypothetical protein